ncbi:DOK4 [Branchiostoma lanceolatum]|uniref:DOK4 protein n=1 Tax=Branchiostoma lanceolatum TaxID=7740 RepID=A0A8K0F2A7_BRALA|nr:DOK4 [Branchiostoma lanceolatum]
MAENKTVFKGWLEKCKHVHGSQKGFQLKLKGSVSWKRAFFILHCCHGDSTLHCYEDEPQEVSVSKESLSLSPYYCVYKREGPVKGRTQVFDITTPGATWRLAAADQTNLDLWVHHLQIQAKLRDDLPGQYFTVRPAASESAKRIGAQGQQCLLHVSQWGITLAQEVSRCVLAQWPLKSLRSYGAEDDGKFSFEAGRQAPMGQGVYMFNTHPGQETSIDTQVDMFVQKQAKMADQEKAGKSPTKQETRGRRKGSAAHEPDPDMCSEYATLRRMTCDNTEVSPVVDRNQSRHLSFPQDIETGLLIGSPGSQSLQSSSDMDPASIGRSNVVNIPPSSSSDSTNSTYLAMRTSWSPRSSTTSQSSSSEYEVMSPLSPDKSVPFQSFPSPPRRSGSFQDVSVFPMSPLSNKSGSFNDLSVFSPTLSPSDGSSSYTASQLASASRDSTAQPITMHKRSASVDTEKPGQNPFFSATQVTTLAPFSTTNTVNRPALHRSHSEGNIPPPFTNLASNSPPKLPPKGAVLAGRMSQRSLPPIPGSPLDANIMPFQFTEGLQYSGSHEYQSLLTPEEAQRLRVAESSYTRLADRTRSNSEGQEHLVISPHSVQSMSTMGAEHTLEQGTETNTKAKSPKSIKGLVFTRKTKTFVKRTKSSE